jgi:hypothetical protein
MYILLQHIRLFFYPSYLLNFAVDEHFDEHQQQAGFLNKSNKSIIKIKVNKYNSEQCCELT